MGGLIGRYIIQALGFIYVDAYISMGTPHGGTILANLAPWSASASQMRRGSPFLKELNARPWPPNVAALGLQAQFEEIVIPNTSAKIRFGDNKVIPRTNHASIPLMKRSFVEIVDWLGETPSNYQGTSSQMVIENA
jgi:hypothetical protein